MHMGKSDTTKTIEKLLLSYWPNYIADKKLNKMRPHTVVQEVVAENGTNSSGIVDIMRLDEYFEIQAAQTRCWASKYIGKGNAFADVNLLGTGQVCAAGLRTIGELKSEMCPFVSCPKNCVSTIKTPMLLITAIEIKVTNTDFHSANGHNFCGNANYYAMPFELYKKLKMKNEIPEGIGVICLHKRQTQYGVQYSLKKERECKYVPLPSETMMWLVLSIHKRAMLMQKRQTAETQQQDTFW